ncbi:MAG TPA: polyhydroxyalkanoate depolymerase [Kofleriaceae bacterium]
MHRSIKRYPRQPFGIPGSTEQVVESRPFVELRRFVPTGGPRGPRVLLVAPLSGHHSTLLRDTITSLLEDHDVYVTDWRDARDVPLSEGTFSLDDYVAEVRGFLQRLDAASTHVVAVCQPTVPVLAAVSLDAAAGLPTPRSLTLLGGPVDARVSPTQVNKLASDRSMAWFEHAMTYRVPPGYRGAGRKVYPGFLQLTAFMMMNPEKHFKAHMDYWTAQLTGTSHEAIASHEAFYDEYNAVLDMDARYYLDTVRVVFQEYALARGTWRVDGVLVEPAAIRTTPLLTIEGELDDISGLGQTEAAHALTPNTVRHQHYIARGAGHYGLFSGRRWRTEIYPELRAFIEASK